MKLIVFLISFFYLSSFILSCSAESSAQSIDMNDSIIWREIHLTINQSAAELESSPRNTTPNIMENASISGTAFNDINANSFREENEPGLSNWTIVLIGDGEYSQEADTNADGFYFFEGLKPGRYILKEKIAEGWNQTSPLEASYEINLVYGRGLNYDFGNSQGQLLAASEPSSPSLISRSEWIRMVNQLEAAPNFTTESEPGSAVSYPSSFSLLSYVPSYSLRNQGTCGNCWAWACTGSAEVDRYLFSSLDRLSIQYLNSNFDGGSGRWACCGGNIIDFLQFYNSKGKFIPWNNLNAVYKDGTNHCCLNCPASVCSDTSCCSLASCGGAGQSSVSPGDIIENPSYKIETVPSFSYLNHGITQDQAIDAIKSILTQNKAIVFSFYLPSQAAWTNFGNIWSTGGFWNPDTYCGLPDSDGAGGHAVLCVGYDDASDTWIMLNSWGAGGRGDGTFRVKMHMNYDCSNGGYYSYYFQWFDINFVNRVPTTPTKPSGLASGVVGTAYSYSTSAVDPDGDQVKYTINWGDGATSQTSLVDSGTSASLSHTWSAAGTYQVKAMATDSKTATSSWSSILTVTITAGANKAPDIPSIPSGPASGIAGTTYSYSTSATDPNGDQVKYIINWGDGTSFTTGLVNSGTTSSASHKWSTSGTYLVKARAKDSIGLVSAFSSPLTVTIAPNSPPGVPSVPSGSTSGIVGTSYGYTTSAIDPNGDQVKYTINWGDGKTTTTGLVDSGTAVSISHSWAAVGSYLVKAKATDSKGAASAFSSSITVKIAANSPPNTPSIPTGPAHGFPGTSYDYTTSATDPNGDQVKYIFTFGDATTYTTPLVDSGTPASASHRWSTAGTYLVRAKARDSKGATSALSGSLKVIISASGYNGNASSDQIASPQSRNGIGANLSSNEVDSALKNSALDGYARARAQAVMKAEELRNKAAQHAQEMGNYAE